MELIRNNPETFKKVITEDELWLYGYNPEALSNIKTKFTVFFGQKDVVHHEYTSKGQTIKKDYYQEILKQFRDTVRRKRADL